ncbi:MAG: outer membrane beta-barrel protein [Candidatus Zixiibacteriota bacterium]|nr:MAG: outer membrane beta-barrel protein [candidate division Zixibacteria bacterium]
MRRNKTLIKLLSGCVILSLVLACAASARTPEGKRFEVGLRGGLAVGSIEGEESYLWEKSRTGFLGSAFARYAVADLISLEMNVGYVMKGGKTDIPLTDYTEGAEPGEISGYVQATLISDRVEMVPVVAVTVPVHEKIRPAILGGISLAFAGSSKAKLDDYDPYDLSEATTSTNWGFVVGAEVAYQFESARVFADIRYSRDFGDFHESDLLEWINEVVSIGVGIGFKL